MAKLTAIMTEIGLAPQAEADDRGRYQLRLLQCPFREVAQQHKEVICALHLRLMRGVLTRMRGAVSADRLDPFVEAGLCVARFTARQDPASPAAAQPAQSPG